MGIREIIKENISQKNLDIYKTQISMYREKNDFNNISVYGNNLVEFDYFTEELKKKVENIEDSQLTLSNIFPFINKKKITSYTINSNQKCIKVNSQPHIIRELELELREIANAQTNFKPIFDKVK